MITTQSFAKPQPIIRYKKKRKVDKSNSNDQTRDDDSALPEDDALLRDIVGKTDAFYKDYNQHIERARNFLTFMYVDQWEARTRREREKIGRPTMSFNKLTSIIRSALGENREDSPAMTARAVGHHTTQQQVDVVDGLLRQIAYDSDSDIIYQIALKQQMECGWGSARVVAEYENSRSFKQVLRIKPVLDYQSAFWDNTAQLPDKSDGSFCGIYSVLPLKEFKSQYPDVENPESAIPEGINYFLPWNTVDSIIVAEMYYKEYKKVTICELSDGNVVEDDEAKEIMEKQKSVERSPHADIMGYEPLEIVNRRELDDYQIKHVKFIRNKILERTDYPGKILPIPYAEGDSTVIDGERIPVPYISDALDTQRLVNYIGSEIAYAFLRARKETVIGTTENFEGHEDEWRNPDQVEGYLEFEYDSKGNSPQFIDSKPMNDQYLTVFQSLTNEIYNILGWGEEARGMNSNAQSGTAIAQRKTASKKPVNVYTDNNARLIRSIGKIIIDMLPHVYDSEREIMIMKGDGTSSPVTINKHAGFDLDESGQMKDKYENEIRTGQYDVQIRVDGSYDEQQIAAMNCFIQLSRTNPAIANLIPDLMAEVSGLENTEKLVERLRTLLPPEILAKEEGKPMPPPQPNPQVQIQQQQMQLEQQKIQSQGVDQQLKQKQLALDEQKLAQESQIAGLNHVASLAKANAEINKATLSKDVAIIDHASKMHDGMTKKTVERMKSRDKK